MRWTHLAGAPRVSLEPEHREPIVELYFSPLACSVASRIVCYEAELAPTFIEVDLKAKRTRDGRDFFALSPLGMVPVLRTESGELLTENAAILQYLGDLAPQAALVPRDRTQRARLHQWLSFVGTELHKGLFVPLLDPTASEDVKTYALSNVSRLDWLAHQLTDRTFLLDDFSVADAYLTAILNWSSVTPVALAKWPAVERYLGRQRERPSVQRALGEELALYRAEQAGQRAR